MINWYKLGKKEGSEPNWNDGNLMIVQNQYEILESYLGPYNRWVVCTSFNISNEQLEQVKMAAGVEDADRISCYRLKMVIGTEFDEVVVKKTVEEILKNKHIKLPQKSFLVAELSLILNELANTWAIVEYEGQAAYFCGSFIEDGWSDDLATVLKQAAYENNGAFISSGV